jgi:hypothetical protein
VELLHQLECAQQLSSSEGLRTSVSTLYLPPSTIFNWAKRGLIRIARICSTLFICHDYAGRPDWLKNSNISRCYDNIHRETPRSRHQNFIQYPSFYPSGGSNRLYRQDLIGSEVRRSYGSSDIDGVGGRKRRIVATPPLPSTLPPPPLNWQKKDYPVVVGSDLTGRGIRRSSQEVDRIRR